MPPRRPPTRELLPIVIPQIRGEPDYAEFVAELLRRTQAADPAHAPRNRAELVEAALAAYAMGHGLAAPKRANPHGTNRYGKPEKNSA